jgi:hypothetical protein
VLLLIVVGEEMIPPSIPLTMSISPFDASAMFADAICVGNKLAVRPVEGQLWDSDFAELNFRKWPPADGLACTAGFDPEQSLVTGSLRAARRGLPHELKAD